MAKEKDYSTNLANLLAGYDFKLYLGELDEEIACMASQDMKYFDTYGAGRVMLVNNKMTVEERRVAIAQTFTAFLQSYGESDADFYLELKRSELKPEEALDVLIDPKRFAKRFKKVSKKEGYNQAVMTLSKEFMVRPSLVAKYAKRK